MAVQACVKAKMMDEIDEDDGPIVFKRSNTTSKHNQVNSDTKKSASQRYDGQSRKQASDVHSSNGQSSTSQKGNPYAKASPMKSPTASPKPSTSSARASPVANSKALTSSDDQSRHLSKQNTITVVKEEKQLIKPVARPDADSEDSEDDKPLSARLFAGLSKGTSNHANKRPNNVSLVSPPFQKPKVNKYSDNSDDETPLSSRFQFKSNAEASTSKSCSSYENKPLASKLQQNGSVMRDKKSPTVVNKRPLGEVKTSGQSLVKKPKLSDASTTINSKQASVKAEPKADDDDDDHVPISQRMKKSAISGNKSSSTKQKVTKVVSSSIKKTNKKSKKVMKKSKYSQSSKLPPSSGEGQKWTTLVHNGVIFPPPYKPHGVKMLYKGQPVNLTPEQEEVATMFAVMLDTDYMNKAKFKENFMNDWRKILGKNHVIQKLEDCNFTPIYEWHQKEKEKKKQMSTEEKKAVKEEKLKQEEKYMWAVVDGVKEKVTSSFDLCIALDLGMSTYFESMKFTIGYYLGFSAEDNGDNGGSCRNETSLISWISAIIFHGSRYFDLFNQDF